MHVYNWVTYLSSETYAKKKITLLQSLLILLGISKYVSSGPEELERVLGMMGDQVILKCNEGKYKEREALNKTDGDQSA